MVLAVFWTTILLGSKNRRSLGHPFFGSLTIQDGAQVAGLGFACPGDLPGNLGPSGYEMES
jgi:hypothetical protein